LQAAKDNRSPVFIRQTTDLLINPSHQFSTAGIGIRNRFLRDVSRPLPKTLLLRPVPSSSRNSQGDSIKPVADIIAPGDRRGFARQHEKRRLERILGILLMGQDSTAHTPNERPVTFDQGCEGGLIAANGERVEQITVRMRNRGAATEQAVQILERVTDWPDSH
jgi:hypothetical protein